MAESGPVDDGETQQEWGESRQPNAQTGQRSSEAPEASQAATRRGRAASPELSPGASPQPSRRATRQTRRKEQDDQSNEKANNVAEIADNAEGEENEDDWDSDTEYQHRFLAHLGKYAKDNGLESQLSPFQAIGDTVFGLYHLLQAVVAQDVQFEDVDWSEVAAHEALDLDGEDTAVTGQLREIYATNLRDFVANCHLYLDIEEDGDQEEEGEDVVMDDAQPQPEADRRQTEGPSHIPDTYDDFDKTPRGKLVSSPLVAPSTSKRSLYESQVTRSRKRRRLSASAEIPSTPDERLGVIRPSIEQDAVEEEEEADKEQPEVRSSTVKRRLFNVEVRDSQDDSQDAFTQAKKSQRRSGRTAGDPTLTKQDTAVDVTPSQQLHSEDLSAASPEGADTIARLRTSPTPKEVVPRTQASGATRTPQSSKSTEKTPRVSSKPTANEGQGSNKSPAKARRAANPDSPRHVPPAVVPPRRSLPAGFAGKKVQPRVPSSNPPQGPSSSHSPQALTSNNKAQPKTSSSISAKKPSSTSSPQTTTSSRRPQTVPEPNIYDPDSQDPQNEPPGRPRLTSGLSTLSDWINHYQSFYPRPIVNIGLKATTMTPGGQAAETMESLRQGKGIPTNYEGVWTERDDKGVEMVDAVEKELGETLYVAKGSNFNAKGKGTLDRRGKARKEKARLMDKHGEERMKTRLRFLEAQRNEAVNSKAGRIERWRQSMDASTGPGT